MKFLTRKLGLLGALLALIPLGIVLAPSASASAKPPDNIVNWNTQGAICLGISGGKTDAPAVVWTCNTHADQLWRQGKEYGRTGYYQLVNNHNQCLGVSGGSTKEGARVVSWTCLTGHKDQYWKWDTTRNCSYDYLTYNTLDNLKSRYVLGIAGNSSKSGAAVVIWRYQGKCNNQFWDYY